MEYEYVALYWKGCNPEMDLVFCANRAERVHQGWREYARAPWGVQAAGGACIMRRPKDEPRKWTRGELRDVIHEMFDDHRVLRGGWNAEEAISTEDIMTTPDKEDTKGSVLNERAMQADLCGRLEKRNAELQEAIDQVVDIAQTTDPRDRTILDDICNIKQHLYPLATKKEESNGI